MPDTTVQSSPSARLAMPAATVPWNQHAGGRTQARWQTSRGWPARVFVRNAGGDALPLAFMRCQAWAIFRHHLC